MTNPAGDLRSPTIYHDIQLSTGGWGPKVSYLQGGKETLHLTYEATWRGRPVEVTMQADRYVHSEGWSEWRVYAERAREVSASPRSLPADLTETARHRLSDEFKPRVEAWLASKAYQVSERAAYVFAVKQVGQNLRYSSRDLRLAIEANSSKIGADNAKALLAVADAYDDYASALEAI